MERISYLLGSVQQSLFSVLRDEVGDLTQKERQLVLVLGGLDIEKHVFRHHWRGHKPKERKNISRAFVAKAFYDIPTTEALIDRLKRDRVLRRLSGAGSTYNGHYVTVTGMSSIGSGGVRIIKTRTTGEVQLVN